MTQLQCLEAQVIACERCPRLRSYCQGLAAAPPARHRGEAYWARPVPAFGPEDARLLIVGLAPAAHGSNRTGRMFTGDVDPRSWLMEGLHAVGRANQPSSRHPDDGLLLTDTRIVAAARCAPPDNRPTADELAHCRPYLADTLRLMPRLRVVVALGVWPSRPCAWRRGRAGAGRTATAWNMPCPTAAPSSPAITPASRTPARAACSTRPGWRFGNGLRRWLRAGEKIGKLLASPARLAVGGYLCRRSAQPSPIPAFCADPERLS